MSQSRKASAFESAVNTVSGFLISLVLQALLMRLMNFPFTAAQNVFVVSAFTIVSFVRSYALRRIFNSRNKDLS